MRANQKTRNKGVRIEGRKGSREEGSKGGRETVEGKIGS